MKIYTKLISIGISREGDGVLKYHRYFRGLWNRPGDKKRITKLLRDALIEITSPKAYKDPTKILKP